MLVVLSKRARGDDVPILASFSWIDVHNADNTRGARLYGNTTGLVEFVSEDVFVVC